MYPQLRVLIEHLTNGPTAPPADHDIPHVLTAVTGPIDPPCNTGARDWQYNNDYVDSSDAYRHSKWLSMMQKRLKIAKRLLNPDDSLLIVTIDEKEYLHLGCLLEEMFPEANIQMVTDVINAKGVARINQFSSRMKIYVCIALASRSAGQHSANHSPT